jgi:hypothetical protein
MRLEHQHVQPSPTTGETPMNATADLLADIELIEGILNGGQPIHNTEAGAAMPCMSADVDVLTHVLGGQC